MLPLGWTDVLMIGSFRNYRPPRKAPTSHNIISFHFISLHFISSLHWLLLSTAVEIGVVGWGWIISVLLLPSILQPLPLLPLITSGSLPSLWSFLPQETFPSSHGTSPCFLPSPPPHQQAISLLAPPLLTLHPQEQWLPREEAPLIQAEEQHCRGPHLLREDMPWPKPCFHTHLLKCWGTMQGMLSLWVALWWRSLRQQCSMLMSLISVLWLRAFPSIKMLMGAVIGKIIEAYK